MAGLGRRYLTRFILDTYLNIMNIIEFFNYYIEIHHRRAIWNVLDAGSAQRAETTVGFFSCAGMLHLHHFIARHGGANPIFGPSAAKARENGGSDERDP
ncbi:hypothetical protein [Paracoccus sp. (in: a-proteobacteria)]|uniref:hypothetical protein n=1 Tax=Paracoccus sp. TaxID=267 RepID=UPI0028A6C4C6|nr:hypothetical protein [Paracoccus sp. (in: a-proteobacteria)]